MFGDIPSLILKEIILRMNYKSMIILKLLNKKFNYQIMNIVNNIIWQQQYLEFRYPKIKINSNNFLLISLIKLLDSKPYSNLLETGFSQNERLTVFVRLKDDSFIVYFGEVFRNNRIEHTFETTNKNSYIIELINKEMIDNLEGYLFSQEFYRINIENFEQFLIKTKDFCENLMIKRFRATRITNLPKNILIHKKDYDIEMLKVINEL